MDKSKKLSLAQAVEIGKTFTPEQELLISQWRSRLVGTHKAELAEVHKNRYEDGWNAGVAAWKGQVRKLMGWKD